MLKFERLFDKGVTNSRYRDDDANSWVASYSPNSESSAFKRHFVFVQTCVFVTEPEKKPNVSPFFAVRLEVNGSAAYIYAAFLFSVLH